MEKSSYFHEQNKDGYQQTDLKGTQVHKFSSKKILYLRRTLKISVFLHECSCKHGEYHV